VRFETTQTQAKASGLLCTCRDLHYETTAALNHLYLCGVRYKLGVLIIDSTQFWPTWLHIPAFQKHVEAVDVTFRNATKDPEVDLKSQFDVQRHPVFRGGILHIYDEPPNIAWCLYFLLELFLVHGPKSAGISVSHKNRNQRRQAVATAHKSLWPIASVKTLNIAFEAGPGVTLPQQTVHEHDPRHPGWLGSHTTKYIQEMFCRIGQICTTGPAFRSPSFQHLEDWLYFGDTIFMNIDLRERLHYRDLLSEDRDLWYVENRFEHLPRECRLLAFWNWKYKAVRKRQELGLPMPEERLEWPKWRDIWRWRKFTEVSREVAKSNGDLDYQECYGRCLCHEHELEDAVKRGELPTFNVEDR
jgi:hypothetical protein